MKFNENSLGECLGAAIANYKDSRMKDCAKALVAIVEIVRQLEADLAEAKKAARPLSDEELATIVATVPAGRNYSTRCNRAIADAVSQYVSMPTPEEDIPGYDPVNRMFWPL